MIPNHHILKEYNSGTITYENKTIFTSLQISDFDLQATPNAFSDYLIIQGKHTLVKCVDQDGGNLHIASSDQQTIITFVVPEGYEITQWIDDYYTIPTPLIEEKGENGTVSSPRNRSARTRRLPMADDLDKIRQHHHHHQFL